MTDKEIVERAKEAEKRTSFGELVHRPISKGVNSAFGIGFVEGMVEYRNSLQEESVSRIWHDASEKPERDDLLIETNDGRIIHRQSINNYGMVKRWAYTSDLLNLDNSCNFGKNLQEEPVSEDLAKAAKENAKIERSDDTEVGYDINRFGGFVDGANWQKEQMMAKAVTLVVKEFYGEGDEVAWLIRPSKILDKKFHIGDKVKVIIIKEE